MLEQWDTDGRGDRREVKGRHSTEELVMMSRMINYDDI